MAFATGDNFRPIKMGVPHFCFNLEMAVCQDAIREAMEVAFVASKV
jgi:hypothetical protein